MTRRPRGLCRRRSQSRIFQPLTSTFRQRYYNSLQLAVSYPKVTIMARHREEFITKTKEILLRRRDALRKALAGDLSLLKELEQTSGDVVDFALDTVQDELNSQLAEVESRELASIDKALERIREGSFGECEGCGASIPVARLQALPYATLCIKCQRELEELGPDGVSWAREDDVSTYK